MFHIQKSLRLGDLTLLLCRLFCDNATHCHYHCPACLFTSTRKALMQLHVKEQHRRLLRFYNSKHLSKHNLKTFNENLQKRLVSTSIKNTHKSKIKINTLCEVDRNISRIDCVGNTNTFFLNSLTPAQNNNPTNLAFENCNKAKPIKIIKIEEPLGSNYILDSIPDTIIKLEPEDEEESDMYAATYCDATLDEDVCNVIKMELNHADDGTLDLQVHKPDNFRNISFTT